MRYPGPGDRRTEPNELEEGTYWRHVSPRSHVTIWKLVSLAHVDYTQCRIQLLFSDQPHRNDIGVGTTCTYPKETLQYYKLWNLVSEEEAIFEILGGLP